MNKYQRYRLKDLEGYRKKKRELARTDHHKAIRREYMRKWRELNRERHNELARQSQHRNKHKHVGKARIQHLKRAYGMTELDYQMMFDNQKGCCKICLTDKPSRWNKFHIVHNHVTGKVRGLLCAKCNSSLGWLEKYKQEALNYLETNS